MFLRVLVNGVSFKRGGGVADEIGGLVLLLYVSTVTEIKADRLN